MPEEYPLYAAKAKLSALVRQVREGRSFVITVHGEPVAELRPYQPKPEAQTLAERIEELRAKGLITPARTAPTPGTWPPRSSWLPTRANSPFSPSMIGSVAWRTRWGLGRECM